ncbi:MAG: DegT/DnrJ/EryC1/StrS family aminotransferase [Bdellovibrionaceae bacterium]|nr:DegT/DnrJ/EryC1/StrS family aminotransferase [Bdellovibrionales bacterium]MCB9086703.1 DegT/DnrJ/EryC1/StrS family aminotransferase [Pseudobdellovibrionaceae bacterium]
MELTDLKVQYKNIKDEVWQAIAEVMDKAAFVQGSVCQKFADDFATAHGSVGAVPCSNGTAAIELVLRALNIGAGDEVLIPNNTFFGTVEPVVRVGAKPVFVDVVRPTYSMNFDHLESLIGDRTKMIIPVHLYGHPENMDRVMEIAAKKGLKVVEDCAQAHLAKWMGRSVGTFDQAGTFSFYPSKNLGAFGNAGAVVSESDELLQKVSILANHGRTDRYLHGELGSNETMDGIQAAVLGVKLKYLAGWTGNRREHAAFYDSRLLDRGFQILEPSKFSYAVYHLYVVEVSNRDDVINHLREVGIQTGIHYPVPMDAQPALQTVLADTKSSCPKSHEISQRLVSLPLYPEMTADGRELVMEKFLEVARP